MKSVFKALVMCGLLAAVTAVSACTVKPLYATSDADFSGGTAAALASVAVSEQNTRYGLEVRNHLMFLLHGGATPPATPRYKLDLSVTSVTASAATIQRAGVDEPTAGTVRMKGSYTLTDAATGAVLGQGTREVSSAFDRPRQEYAVLRAERDAQNRAARELAEVIRLSVAQNLAASPGI